MLRLIEYEKIALNNFTTIPPEKAKLLSLGVVVVFESIKYTILLKKQKLVDMYNSVCYNKNEKEWKIIV